MRSRALVLLVLFVSSVGLSAGPRRRAAGKQIPYDQSTPGGWLAANAYVLATPELVPFTGDLQPFRAMVGDADMVALGDGTHGTHEFFAIKLRLIDLLVREAGFDVVALEAPFTVMNDLETYVQGGPGDPRALLRSMRELYFFWDAEEVLAAVEWMREYNAHRGQKPAVHIAGFDGFMPYPASRAVIAYLTTVDPAGVATVETQYGCLAPNTSFIDAGCAVNARMVRDALAAREAELTAKSSAAAFHEALQNARVVAQNEFESGQLRDQALAENALWLRQHRGATQKIILWGHSLHFSKTATEWLGPVPMGKLLADQLGSEYFSTVTLTAAGSFLQFDFRRQVTVATTILPLQATSYEALIRQRGEPFLLIPLRGNLPSWLTTPARRNLGGTLVAPNLMTLVESLPEHFDAAIFIDTTRPITPTSFSDVRQAGVCCTSTTGAAGFR
jgi:erythromycin esterase